MKEVCRFEDSKGRFHRTKKEVEKAEAQIKLLLLQKDLEKFTYDLARILDIYYSNRNYTLSISGENGVKVRHEELDKVYERIADRILRNTEMFLKLIESKKTLQKEYDILASKTHRNDWWLKFVWWK